MLKKINFNLIVTGLAVFSLLFGAGNLMYPIAVGIEAGKYNLIALSGFLVTAVLLPLMGLFAMILYNGDYENFFNRLGLIPGKIMIAICMIIIGPGLVIPRIVAVAHCMMAPFLYFEILKGYSIISLFIFSTIYLSITFLGGFKENKIVDVLGYIISPVLLISLITVIIKGLIIAENVVTTKSTPLALFGKNIIRGYQTLDLLGTLFFASIIIKILKEKLYKKDTNSISLKKLATFGLKAGAIGVGLLSIVYIGIGIIAAYHGHGLSPLRPGLAFQKIVLQIAGTSGAALLAIATLMACLSTSIGLGAVTAKYIQENILNNKISYKISLLIIMIASMPLSLYGIKGVLAIAGGPITFIGYPTLIALTVCNILYKLFGFKYVKIPVFSTFFITFISYYIF